MRSTSLLTRAVTSVKRKSKQDADPRYTEESPETPLSRVPLGQGKPSVTGSQPERTKLPPDQVTKR